MSFLKMFGRQRKEAQQYDPVSEEEDKMLPTEQEQPTRQELLDLQKSNKNLKRILGIFVGASCLFGALVAFRAVRYDKLMLPQILRTPVPPSKLFKSR